METKINAFALALFELGNEEKCLEAFLKDANFTLEVIKTNPEIVTLFKSYFISQEEKNDILEKVFKKHILPLFMNFLKVLNSKKLLVIVSQIIEKFILEVNLSRNIIPGKVYSTKAIKKNELHKIEKFILKKINQKTVLTNEIDKSLISGIKIQVGDYVFEDNVKNQLEQVKNAVFKEGE